jgi:hypothetical protein
MRDAEVGVGVGAECEGGSRDRMIDGGGKVVPKTRRVREPTEEMWRNVFLRYNSIDKPATELLIYARIEEKIGGIPASATSSVCAAPTTATTAVIAAAHF